MLQTHIFLFFKLMEHIQDIIKLCDQLTHCEVMPWSLSNFEALPTTWIQSKGRLDAF